VQYLIVFLEGIVTFISPCLLPLLPVYVFYFAGRGQLSTGRTLANALGFVLGFTLVFVALGALAGTVGSWLAQYQTAVNIVTGGIVIIFGLSYLGIIPLSFLKGMKSGQREDTLNFFSSLLFGIVFSISWTPCVGAFLGSALMLASQQGQMLTGTLMLLCFSLGLSIPFVASALLIDKFMDAFNAIKRHYDLITKISGGLLVALGLAMATGLLGQLLTALA